MFASGGLGEHGQHLPIMMLERPLRRRAPCGLGAGGPARGIEQLLQRSGQLIAVVRIVDHQTLARRMHDFGCAVVVRGEDRQTAGQRLQHDQRARIVERWMHKEIGGEIAIAHFGAVADEADALGDVQPPRQALECGRILAARNQQTKRRLGRQQGHGAKQRLQSLQAVIHAGEQCNRMFGRQAPLLPPFQAAARPVALIEAIQIDGDANHA